MTIWGVQFDWKHVKYYKKMFLWYIVSNKFIQVTVPIYVHKSDMLMEYCGPAHWAYKVTLDKLNIPYWLVKHANTKPNLQTNKNYQLFENILFSYLKISMYKFSCISMVFIKKKIIWLILFSETKFSFIFNHPYARCAPGKPGKKRVIKNWEGRGKNSLC